jgi:Putative DNA-binding domain
MINKPFNEIDKEEIKFLLANEVLASKTLIYRSSLPDQNREKLGFLIEISALANAAGGDLVIGIKQVVDAANKPTGKPNNLLAECGLENQELPVEAAIASLTNLISNGIEPPIVGLRMKSIVGFKKGPVIVVRVPASFNAPHMVAYGEHSLFYSRSSTSSYRLSVSELRAAFIASENLTEKIRRFKAGRLARIIAEETPISLAPGPKYVLHLLPLISFSTLGKQNAPGLPTKPIHQDSANRYKYPANRYRYNFDGYVAYQVKGSELPTDYLQIFRNGALEIVQKLPSWTNERNKRFRDQKEVPTKSISSYELENSIINNLLLGLELQRKLQIDAPVFVVLTLLGIKDYSLIYTVPFFGNYFPDFAETIDLDVAPIPEELLETIDLDRQKLEKSLQPLFDIVWQTAGYPCCKNYDKEGIYRGYGEPS